MARTLLTASLLAAAAATAAVAGGCASPGVTEQPYALTGERSVYTYRPNQIDEVNRGKARAKGETYFYVDPYNRPDMTPAVR